jgi:hypothetical protein
MTAVLGSVSKASSDYVAALTEAIKGDRSHPRHHGVKMQAHHLISEKGVSLSGLGAELVRNSWFINDLKNLVFLPCTLRGACHLGVQLHRGDHRAPIDQDKEDRDADKVLTYHTMVSEKLGDLQSAFHKECTPGSSGSVVNKVHRISEQILDLIERGRAPLTSVAKHFKHGNPIGCGGVISVPELKRSAVPCPVGRNHRVHLADGPEGENITYDGQVPYKLKPGN